MRLGSWTFGFVLANQVALFVVTVLAGSVPGQLPCVVHVRLHLLPAALRHRRGVRDEAVTPDLAELWDRQTPAFRRRLSGGLRAVLAIIIPAAVGMLLLARPAVALLSATGHEHP